MRYGRAVVWLLTGILAGMSPTVQTVEAAEAAAQSKPPASSAAQGADGKTNTAGTAMDEAAWEAALAAGATVSAVHGTVTPDPAAAQAALTLDGGAAMQQVQPAQQMQQEGTVVQMTPPEVQAAKTTAVPNAPARVQEIMQKFRLSGNPRSGAYSWVYTSPTWTAEAISRPAAGSSYFLLAGSENLRFQSFDCDEVWYFHEGCGMRLTVLAADGTVRTFELGVGGAAMPMVLIPKGQIFAAENVDSAGYSFISCMTIPALETAGIRVWQREELLAKYPQAKEAIERYTDAPWGAARTQETAQAGGDIHG